MLSTTTLSYVMASVPVLREHALSITRCMYQRLFAAHPELKNIFNMSHQHSDKQQQVLASAIFAYAANIQQPEVLSPVIERIVHKHVSLGIRAEHYPIVGKHLVDTIAEVLAPAATPELLAAWTEAYTMLAGILIEKEHQLYQKHGMDPGKYRAVKIVRKQKETESVTSFYLQSADSSALPHFQPGQYISVAVDVAELGLRQFRQYSLSCTPDQEYWRISVKREQGSPRGTVSNLLHDQYHEGNVLWVGPPSGNFILSQEQSDVPVVLISAGVGITPMMSILCSTLQDHPERSVIFLYATQNSDAHPFRQELHQLGKRHDNLQIHVSYADPAEMDKLGEDYHQLGYLQLTQLSKQLLPLNAVYFLCGPVVFMRAQRSALRAQGVENDRIQEEIFGPALLEIAKI